MLNVLRNGSVKQKSCIENHVVQNCPNVRTRVQREVRPVHKFRVYILLLRTIARFILICLLLFIPTRMYIFLTMTEHLCADLLPMLQDNTRSARSPMFLTFSSPATITSQPPTPHKFTTSPHLEGSSRSGMWTRSMTTEGAQIYLRDGPFLPDLPSPPPSFVDPSFCHPSERRLRRPA